MCTADEWEHLVSFPTRNIGFQQKRSPPLYYTDINDQEWIIFLHNGRKYVYYDDSDTGSYLYDVETDKIVPFMDNYSPSTANQIDMNFQKYLHKSYIIDNKNHVLYCLMCSYRALMVEFDIKDLNNVKFLHETQVPRALEDHTMLLVGNTIQFVLGAENPFYDHHEFDIITRKVKLVDANIHSKYIDPNRVTYEKILNCFENLSIGHVIDVRDTVSGKFYLAKIVDIKNKEFEYNDHEDNHDGSTKTVVKSMKIKVHYQGWDEKYDEWIDISKETSEDDLASIEIAKKNKDSPQLGAVSRTSLCDCKGVCFWSQFIYKNKRSFSKYHRIALVKSQSIRYKSLKGVNAVYSQSENKLIILGSSENYQHCGNRDEWSGLYYKSIHHQHLYHDDVTQLKQYDYRLLVNGYVHGVEENISHLFINIPNDINQIIFKYYYIPNDKQWTQAEKMLLLTSDGHDHDDKNYNYRFERDLFANHFYFGSGCVVANNGDDIFIFGGQKGYDGTQSLDILKLNIKTNVLTRLTDIKCPSCQNKESLWYAVLCTKSKNIHLFHRTFIIHAAISLERLNSAKSVVVDS